MLFSWQTWRMFLRYIPVRAIHPVHLSIWTETTRTACEGNTYPDPDEGRPVPPVWITSMSETARPICSCSLPRLKAGGMSRSRTAAQLLIMPILLKELSDVHFPEAEKIILVQDNLTTHCPGLALQGLSRRKRQRRLVQRFEWHYTPKHGSWLNMAEIEFSALARPMSEPPYP